MMGCNLNRLTVTKVRNELHMPTDEFLDGSVITFTKGETNFVFRCEDAMFYCKCGCEMETHTKEGICFLANADTFPCSCTGFKVEKMDCEIRELGDE